MVELDQFKQTYITECFELLGDMEERLLSIDTDAPDDEALNAIFRCAHSIKGGAGAFGFDFITSFTHVLEALLDSLREGKVQLSREIVDTLLKASDIVTQMVDAANDGGVPVAGFGDEIKKKLEEYAGLSCGNKNSDFAAKNKQAHIKECSWVVEFTPKDSLFSTGNEPLLILRELKRLGEAEIKVDESRLPSIDVMDATACYLSWTVTLRSACSENEIREVFEFVEDHCFLNVKQLDVPDYDDLALSCADNASSEMTVANASNEVVSFEHRDAEVVDISASHPDHPAVRVASQTTSIRVDLEKVDRLVNMVGELVITEAMLHMQARKLASDEHAMLMRGMEELAQHTRELQEAVMSVRMQPVKSIFSRMPRIVRDISAQLGKVIALKMEGENTEVDKTVIEQLADPLMHMMRNSCDHGIETPDIRAQKNKPVEGTITLSANHRGGRIVIEISDDGAGIDRDRVLQKAKEKGVVASDAALAPDEIDNLIFLPGFSTAETVTNVSGRGVGMDVVKKNIESMGGTVRITNHPGSGAAFTVSLPLTLAILDGMIVRVGEENYIIPITNILETLRPKKEEVLHVEGHGDVINVRGEFIPLVYLYRTFNIAQALREPSTALIVLVESNRQKIGLVVDELIGQQQVVIKSLEANADPVKGISGATILGDGRVSLILEINELAGSDEKSGSSCEPLIAA